MPHRRRPISLSPISRRAFLGLSASGLITAAAGCGRRQSAGPQKDDQGRLVVRFWNGFTGPDGKTMERLVRRFQDENRDVAVKMQIIPWGTYYDKITLSLAYGGAPELFIIHADRVPQYAAFDVLASLPSADFAPADQFAPVAWQASFYEGKHYALPLDIHPMGLYYNRKLFRDAGIDAPPTDWESFLAAARATTRDTDNDGRPDQWGFLFTNLHTCYDTFLAQEGGQWLQGNEATVDTPESRAAFTRMRSLIDEYKVAPNPEGVDAWLAFRQGKCAMAMEGVYMLASLEEQTGLDFGGAPVPQFGPKPGTWGGSHQMAQPMGLPAENAAAAQRLMRFLSDNSLEWGRGGQVPARLDIYRSAAFQDVTVPYQFGKQIPYVQFDPRHPRLSAVTPFLDPAIEDILLGREKIETALADAERRMNQVLKRP